MDKQTKFKVIFYEKEDGSMPAKDFILSLNDKLKAKTLRNIKLLSDYGPELREPESSKLEGDIFEIRTKVGTNLTRVLYFFLCRRKGYFDKWFC